jgi:ABC-type long-subunit fatty acid transport system fused permease/ATPase subunit
MEFDESDQRVQEDPQRFAVEIPGESSLIEGLIALIACKHSTPLPSKKR